MSNAAPWVTHLLLFVGALACLSFVAMASPVYARLANPSQYPISSTCLATALLAVLAATAWWQFAVLHVDKSSSKHSKEPVLSPRVASSTTPSLETKPTIHFDCFVVPVPPANATIGGIPWSKSYCDVRLKLVSDAIPIENLDFEISFDNTSIAGVGQISHIPDFTASPVTRLDMPGGSVSMDFPIIAYEAGTGRPTDVIDPIAGPGNIIAPVFRVICARLYADYPLHLVVAALGGQPRVVTIKGRFETSGVEGFHRYSIDETKQVQGDTEGRDTPATP